MRHRLLLTGLCLCVLVLPARAGEENPAPATYTDAELAALDKALHAANLTRADLTFTKDLAKGHACLEVVRAMLRDPLTIAPQMDAFVADARHADAALHAPLGALAAAHDRLSEPGGPWATGTTRGPYLVLKNLVAAGERAHPAPKGSADLLAQLEWMASVGTLPPLIFPVELAGGVPLGFEDVRYKTLRRFLPASMAWHDVFASPYDETTDATLKQVVEKEGESHVHDLAAQLRGAQAAQDWILTFGDPVAWLKALPPEAFPQDKPLVKETPSGRIALGTPKDDVYEGDYAALIDPGGNDRYVGCRIGAAYGTKDHRVGFFADLGGDDLYDCAEVNVTLGAAVLGVAAFFDLGAGNDRYRGGHCSLGAAMGGCAVFYDDGGTDTYEGRTFTQGAAGFGVGIFMDDATQAAPEMTADEGTKEPVTIGQFDNDRLSAWANAQAFARCRGIALCINTRGNDTYEAGGVYLDAPLFADRYQSFSQGFAIGERGIDYAGGIAMLIDHAGNDRYLGDIYDQGVGYWYSAGLLYDGGGNDLYEMTQYGQGSGIHLAVGGLVDVAGNDTYVMHSGLGQGGSHDYAGSILHDRAGNDHYLGMTSCNGCGLTNSVGLFLDRSGDDTYAGRKGSLNSGRPARGFASIGVFVDLAGQDDYLGIMEDGGVWRQTDIGVGVDVTPPAAEEKPGDRPSLDQDTGTVEIPAVCHTEAALDPKVFDELWALSIRWEVGENRRIVPEARRRLVAYGKDVLPYLDKAMDKGASGLELRAFQDVLTGLQEGGAKEGVEVFLLCNLAHESERRVRVALYLVGEMKVEAAEEAVVDLLASTDESLARRAAGVLARLESHAGDEVLLGWLQHPEQELKVMAALGALVETEADCYPALVPLLDHPLVSVRTHLATLLAQHADAYAAKVEASLAEASLPIRARRTALDVLARSKRVPLQATLEIVTGLLDAVDWGVRADAARQTSIIQRWATGPASRSESTMSRIPPMCGIRVLESLASRRRFQPLHVMPARIDAAPSTRPKSGRRFAWKRTWMPRIVGSAVATIPLATRPAIVPSHDLPGETAGIILCLPKGLPIAQPAMSLTLAVRMIQSSSRQS